VKKTNAEGAEEGEAARGGAREGNERKRGTSGRSGRKKMTSADESEGGTCFEYHEPSAESLILIR